MTAAAIFGSKSGFSSSVGTSGRCGRTRCVMWTSIASPTILYVTFTSQTCFCSCFHPSVAAEREACMQTSYSKAPKHSPAPARSG